MSKAVNDKAVSIWLPRLFLLALVVGGIAVVTVISSLVSGDD